MSGDRCSLAVSSGHGWHQCPGPVVTISDEDGPVCAMHLEDPWATRWSA